MGAHQNLFPGQCMGHKKCFRFCLPLIGKFDVSLGNAIAAPPHMANFDL